MAVPCYAALELSQGQKYDGPSIAVWSLGVILYTGQWIPAFDGQNFKEIWEGVLGKIYHILLELCVEYDNLLKKSFIFNPSKRDTLE